MSVYSTAGTSIAGTLELRYHALQAQQHTSVGVLLAIRSPNAKYMGQTSLLQHHRHNIVKTKSSV